MNFDINQYFFSLTIVNVRILHSLHVYLLLFFLFIFHFSLYQQGNCASSLRINRSYFSPICFPRFFSPICFPLDFHNTTQLLTGFQGNSCFVWQELLPSAKCWEQQLSPRINKNSCCERTQWITDMIYIFSI